MRLLLSLIIGGWLPATLASQQSPYDLLIQHGHIIDGTGSPWYSGDVAIKDGRIAAIGSLMRASAADTIDAAGLVVAPGFIDMLGQSDLTILVNPHLPRKSFRGSPPSLPAKGPA